LDMNINEDGDTLVDILKNDDAAMPDEVFNSKAYRLPEDVSKHLFTDKLSDIKKMDQDLEVRFKKLDDELFEKMMNFMGEDDDEDDDISKLIKRTKTTKVDDYISENQFNSILDKINSEGMSSLSKKELDLLEKYSNQVK